MPKLSQAQQTSRRAHILAAAEACFIRTGFHATTMQAICKEAGISAGALYLYFDSKEALIAGIAEGERERVLGNFAALRDAPDFIAGMHQINQTCIAQMSEGKAALFLEIISESVRNPAIFKILQRVDQAIRAAMGDMLARAVASERIAPALPLEHLVSMIALMFDGLLLRRAIDPHLDTHAIIDLTMQTIRSLVTGDAARTLAGTEQKLEPV